MLALQNPRLRKLGGVVELERFIQLLQDDRVVTLVPGLIDSDYEIGVRLGHTLCVDGLVVVGGRLARCHRVEGRSEVLGALASPHRLLEIDLHPTVVVGAMGL